MTKTSQDPLRESTGRITTIPPSGRATIPASTTVLPPRPVPRPAANEASSARTPTPPPPAPRYHSQPVPRPAPVGPASVSPGEPMSRRSVPPSADAVVEFLAGLSHAAREALLARVHERVEQSERVTRPAPPPVNAARRAPVRTTLHSVDLEEVHELPVGLPQAMGELSFFETAIEGGSFCLVTALKLVPCLAGLVHLYDRTRGDYVLVYAQGPRAEGLLASRTPARDAVFDAATRAGGPVATEYGPGDAASAGAARTAPQRHAFFGDPWSAMAVPILDGGRPLGFIELVDPVSGAFSEDAKAALAFVADRYAAFLKERGVVFPTIAPPPRD